MTLQISSTINSSYPISSSTTKPMYGICLEKVTEPIALKCGHIFDRHCIKKLLSRGRYTCPGKSKGSSKKEFIKYHNIYENLKCTINAGLFF
jgi:RING-type zinc-finger